MSVPPQAPGRRTRKRLMITPVILLLTAGLATVPTTRVEPGAFQLPAAAAPFDTILTAPADTVGKAASWLILPALFSTPETGIGGGGVVDWYPGGGVGARPTSHMVVAMYTEKKQIQLGLFSEAYLAGDGVRVAGEILWQKFPDVFYGIGNDAAESAEEDYTPKTFLLDVVVEWEMRPNVWLGVRAMARNDRMVETEDGGLLASDAVTGADGGSVTGLGVTMRRDTRDTPYSSRKGSLVTIGWTWYGGALGGDFSARDATVNARTFRSVGSGVIALRGYFHQAGGSSVPFTLLPRIGGSQLLRGYREGRFRDRRLAAVEGEVRRPLFWRFDGAVFASLGDVAPSWDELRPVDEMERAWGLGLRIHLTDAGVPLRIDWAHGRRGASGFYVTLGEAF